MVGNPEVVWKRVGPPLSPSVYLIDPSLKIRWTIHVAAPLADRMTNRAVRLLLSTVLALIAVPNCCCFVTTVENPALQIARAENCTGQRTILAVGP